ncbi:Uncharacterised protein [Campylobacter geochelonis]|nr:Uncharacterised protein [Campylobacter geochelonis]
MINLKNILKFIVLVMLFLGTTLQAFRTLPFGDVPTGEEIRNQSYLNNPTMNSPMGTLKEIDEQLAYNNTQKRHKIRWQPTAEFNAPESGINGGVVYGDFVIAGATVINDRYKNSNPNLNFGDYDNFGEYVKDDKINFAINSAKSTLKFINKRDSKVEAKDIVFARLYWQGMIFDNNLHKGNKSHTYLDFYKAIKDYREVGIKVGNQAVETVKADMNDTFVAYSYSNVRNGDGLGYRMWYSTSIDVTDIVKKGITGEADSVAVTVGDIKTTTDKAGDNNYFQLYRFQNNTWTNLRYGSYGGWSLFVVYNNSEKFDPKSVTIYDGFTFLWSGTNNGDSAEMILPFDGFYTPKKPNFDARLGYFMTGITGAGGDGATLQINRSDNFETTNLCTEKYGDKAGIIDMENLPGKRYRCIKESRDELLLGKDFELDAEKEFEKAKNPCTTSNEYKDYKFIFDISKIGGRQYRCAKWLSKNDRGKRLEFKGDGIDQEEARKFLTGETTWDPCSGWGDRDNREFVIDTKNIQRFLTNTRYVCSTNQPNYNNVQGNRIVANIKDQEQAEHFLTYGTRPCKDDERFVDTLDKTKISTDPRFRCYDNWRDYIRIMSKKFEQTKLQSSYESKPKDVTGELNPQGFQYNFTTTYLDKDGKQQFLDSSSKMNKFVDIDIYNLKGKLDPGQSTANIKLKVTSKSTGNSIQTGRSLISAVAFSTDLYVPDICYEDDIYNGAGIKNEFSAIEGETVRNVVKFKNRSGITEQAEGLEVKFVFEDNTKYNENTMRIDNRLENTDDIEDNQNMVYIKDNVEGAFKGPFKVNKAGAIVEDGGVVNDPIYVNRQFNELKTEADGKQNFNIYIGKGAGVKKNGKISGGILPGGKTVYIDYNTTVGKYFKPNKFELNFSFNILDTVVKLKYNENTIPKCSTASKKIKVYPLDGLRIVNQNFSEHSTFEDEKVTNLFTQVANKNFKTKLVYKPDPNSIATNTREKKDDEGNVIIDKDTNKPVLEYEIYGPDGTPHWIDRSAFETEYNKFDLKGQLELSLITRAKMNEVGCKNIVDSDKMPFAFPACPKQTTDKNGQNIGINQFDCNVPNSTYRVSFNNQSLVDLYEGKGKDLKGINIGYARKDYIFMLSYIPSGVDKQDENKTLLQDTTVYLGNSVKGTNAQGAFNVCGADVFTLRPAFIKVKAASTNVRVAGNPGENSDIFNKMFYPTDEGDKYIGGYDSKLITSNYDYDQGKIKVAHVSGEGNITYTYEDFNDNMTYLKPILTSTCDTSNPDVIKDSFGNVIWTKNGAPLTADFGVLDEKGLPKKDGAKILEDELKKYEKKEKLEPRYATVYTDEIRNSDGKLEKVEFNYYNIGDVKVNIYDKFWTINDQNQKDPVLSGCIIGSSSNTPDGNGKVGCDIAVPNDDSVNLRYKHDRVEVGVTNLTDSLNKLGNHYTFYNSVSNEMGAALDMNVTAKLSNDGKYKGIVPTLYSSNCYARDVNFGLDFNFDCRGSGSTGNRCGGAIATSTLEQICANNISDSRCYKVDNNARSNLMDSLRLFPQKSSTSLSNMNIGGMGAITDATKNFVLNGGGAKLNLANLINNAISSGETQSPSIPALTATRAGFVDGINAFKVMVNFSRTNSVANNPVLIYAEDFVRNPSMSIDEQSLPTDTTVSSEGLNTNGIIAQRSSNRFFPYDNRNTTNTIATPTEGVAHFYYGNVNSRLLFYDGAKEGLSTNVLSMIYCDDFLTGVDTEGRPTYASTGACTADTTVFSLLQNRSSAAVDRAHRPGFYVNPAERFNALSIESFVRKYELRYNKSDIEVNRGNSITDDSGEEVIFSSTKALEDDVFVKTSPWFLHNTSFDYNTYRIKLTSVSQWGGKGGIKSGDNLGNFLDSNGSDSDKDGRNIKNPSNRISW